MNEYNEIIKLYEYCKLIGVHAYMSPLFDGFVIRFRNGGDVIQHGWSYGCHSGCVEFAIGSRVDYCATSLKNAKQLIRRHKERLNCEQKGSVDNA